MASYHRTLRHLLGIAVLLSPPAGAWAATSGVFYPRDTAGVVCDRPAGFCADRQGVSMGLTRQFLGEEAQQQLQQTLGNVPVTYLDRFTLSNGVYCNRAAQACYTGRHTSVPDLPMTRRLFGGTKAEQGREPHTGNAVVFFPPGSQGVVCDRKGNFCADRMGISMGMTTLYLGNTAQEKLQRVLGDGAGVHLDTYTLSNGVHCESKKNECYTSKYSQQRDKIMTHRLFGRQGDSVSGR
ncbi:YcgJ family protein [Serratia proteamaculans]|uniref:YcgJ family protein n=1 Tax=Serratia proteamaculans TaxID=28151 RepID=UPI0021776969|nr:YcgJ family protein [Serratia proteamaculans]CAI1210985.1 Fels-1 Prophage Protein-like [Serratia proteamaculans]